MSNGNNLQKMAEQQGIPLRTLEQAYSALEVAKKSKADVAMARLMLRHGRLTDEAIAYVTAEYPQCAS